MQDFMAVISNFGFPVAVASYLLFRFERKLEQLEQTNENLVAEIKGLREKVVELNRVVRKISK